MILMLEIQAMLEKPGPGQGLCMRVKSLQSCLTLCDPMDCSSPGSSVHGISQTRMLGVGFHSLLQGIFPTQFEPESLKSPVLAGGFFTTSTTWEAPSPCLVVDNSAIEH